MECIVYKQQDFQGLKLSIISDVKTYCKNVIYIIIGGSRGRAGARPPIQDPILLFSHTFSLKSAHVGDQNPPKMGPRPPTENPASEPDYT